MKRFLLQIPDSPMVWVSAYFISVSFVIFVTLISIIVLRTFQVHTNKL